MLVILYLKTSKFATFKQSWLLSHILSGRFKMETRQTCFNKKLFFYPIFFVALAGFLFLSGCALKLEPVDKNKILDLQGHRGARGVRPENTMPAFQYCIEQQMTSLELDTVVTKDNQLIISHETDLNGKLCLDETGVPAKTLPIKNLTVSELKKFDCGSLKNEDFPDQELVPGTRLITLMELFAHTNQFEIQTDRPEKLLFNVELKFRETYSQNDIQESAALMVQIIEEAGLTERVTVQSFVIDLLPVIKKLNPKIKTAALFQPTYPQGIQLMLGFKANSDEIMQQTIGAGADIISPYYLYIKPDFVKTAHSNRIKVLPWTVNEEKMMIEMMNLNVDGLISDYPKRLFTTYQKWKQSAE